MPFLDLRVSHRKQVPHGTPTTFSASLPQPAPATGGGFTLIEVPTVVAIISVLAALLAPVFLSAREKSRQSVCASNLSQLYKTVALYTADSDGLTPAYEVGRTGLNVKGQEVIWPDQGADLVRSLRPHGASPELWFCPDDPLHGKTGVLKRHPATSYFYFGGIRVLPSGAISAWPLLPTRRSASDVGLFLDDIMPYMSETPPDTYLYTHSSRFNIIFCDGHVRTMSPHDDDCEGYCH